MFADINALLAALSHPALMINREGRIVAANAGARALFVADMVDTHFLNVLRQPNVTDAIEATQRDLTTHKARFLANAGTQDLTYVVTCAPVDIPATPLVLVGFEDISHMEQTGQMRRDFVANVSHELRTPLTALLGFIETLLGPAREDAVARDRFLSIMQTEAARMNRIVDDLLSLSRVEADVRIRPQGKVDLVALVKSSVERLTPLAAERGVGLTVDMQSLGATQSDYTVPGDEDQLRQVLNNLIENALKYGGDKGQVTIAFTPPAFAPALRKKVVGVTVSDTGVGIDPVHIPRLTERFYRVDSHRSRQVGGTGLGLAIAKHIIGRHRGLLKVNSVKGQGSQFSVILPVET